MNEGRVGSTPVQDAEQSASDNDQMPPFKKRYFASSCSVCPFCGSRDLGAGPLAADGTIAWSAVECPGCGYTWQDVWTLVDMTEVTDGQGKPLEGGDVNMD